jgi:O-methyltransferase
MVDELLVRYPIISEQVDRRELRVILTELDKVLNRGTEGEIVEFGCYEGTTSLFIQRLLEARGSDKKFHVYDSFAGLPEKSAQDLSPAGEQFKVGELRASKQRFVNNFRQAGLTVPIIHKDWFGEIPANEVPKPVAFAFLDGDFYESIRDSLRLVGMKLSPAGVIIVDDYQSEALPGAAKAVDEWLLSHPHRLRTEASLAVIKLV